MSCQVYMFEDEFGQPCRFTTMDPSEARHYADDNDLKVIAYIHDF